VLLTRVPDSSRTGDGGMLCELAEEGPESVVSGLNIPTGFILDRRSGTMVSSSSGGLEPPSDLLMKLTSTGKDVEALIGGTVEIEWLWKDNCLWILQARPYTGEYRINPGA